MKKILLSIEDDDAAYLLLRIAFDQVSEPYELHRVCDGMEGLAFLHRLGSYRNAPRPHLILLNLNMPRLSGFEVLDALRGDESINDIPVIVFSSSSLDSDRAKCLALGAKQYVTKPHDFDKLVTTLKAICASA